MPSRTRSSLRRRLGVAGVAGPFGVEVHPVLRVDDQFGSGVGGGGDRLADQLAVLGLVQTGGELGDGDTDTRTVIASAPGSVNSGPGGDGRCRTG
jgi:hypothetical protein